MAHWFPFAGYWKPKRKLFVRHPIASGQLKRARCAERGRDGTIEYRTGGREARNVSVDDTDMDITGKDSSPEAREGGQI